MTAKHYGILAACVLKLALGVYLVHSFGAKLHAAHLCPHVTDNQDSLKETQAL